jgi:hypothetical protein
MQYNRRQIKKSQNNTSIGLSQRYQQCENLRTVKVFGYLAISMATGNIVTLMDSFLFTLWIKPKYENV